MKWYKSWTLWFNVLCGSLQTAQYMLDMHYIDATWVVAIVAWGNMIIRVLKTNSPITGLPSGTAAGKVDSKTVNR